MFTSKLQVLKPLHGIGYKWGHIKNSCVCTCCGNKHNQNEKNKQAMCIEFALVG